MDLPNVIHPKTFVIGGIYIQVVSRGPLTDEQAARVAQHFYRRRRFKKSDQGKLFQALTEFDQSTAGLL